MNVLVLGLVLFLSTHSVRIVADGWRSRQIARVGATAWKAVYGALSMLGFLAIVWGYELSRREGAIVLWEPPMWLHHIALSLMVLASLLITAAYVPNNVIKARLGHPMLLGIKTWAGTHLLVNGGLADILLFGSLLIWAILCFKAARNRDRMAAVNYGISTPVGNAAVLVVGIGLYWVFARYLHPWLIGVAVLPGT